MVHIAANKNTVPGDVSAMVPGGIRMGKLKILFYLMYLFFFFIVEPPKHNIYLFQFYENLLGTPALTSRGFLEDDFAKVADFFDAAVGLAVSIKGQTQGSILFYFLLVNFCKSTGTYPWSTDYNVCLLNGKRKAPPNLIFIDKL